MFYKNERNKQAKICKFTKTEFVILFVSCKLVKNEVVSLETISISFEIQKINLFVSWKEKNKNFKNNNPTVTTFPENFVTPLIINMFISFG